MQVVVDSWASWGIVVGGIILSIWSVGIIILRMKKSKGEIRVNAKTGEVSIGEEEAPAQAEQPATAAMLQAFQPQQTIHECTQADTLKGYGMLLSPMADALIALLQATKGQINGNIDYALSSMQDSKKEYTDFLVSHLSDRSGSFDRVSQ